MSGHQTRLLLCSAASVALIVGALFVVEWFRIDLADTHMTIGLQDGTICVADGTCRTVGLRGMGAYRVLAEGAFWNALLLALLVLAQCGMHVFGGAASRLATRIGYVIGSITLVCAFSAGYVFAPDPPAELAALGLVVTRTFAPALLVIGSLLGVLAIHYAQLEQVSDEVGEYKPVVVHKDAHDDGRSSAAAPADSGLRARAPSQSGLRTRAPSESGVRARAPSEPGTRTRTPSQQVERIPLPGQRTKAPSQEPAVARTTSASQEVEWIPLPGRRTKSPSQPPAGERTKAPSQQPPVARTTSPSQPIERVMLPGERTRAPSQPPAVARTTSPSQQVEWIPLPGHRTKSPSQPPAVARTTSPSYASEPAVARTSSPSPADELATDVPSRARTSSSGPIDLAARLSGAPIAVAIKPPLPEPVPVPPDQIPVAPESGLVIRKRTPSAGPLSTHQLHAADAPAAAMAAAHEATRQAFGALDATPAASGITPPGAMPSIELRAIDPDIDNPLAPPAQSQLPSVPDELPAVARAFTPPDKPAALRGKLKFAVNLATLTSLGITAQREDGTSKHVGWDDIIGIIARRLPVESPYEGATFVDLVSTAGSTLRILPWTRLDGAPVRGDGEERARAFVQLIAARCLEARLDSWTKVFADGTGHAAQLPSTHTLAAHDDKLA